MHDTPPRARSLGHVEFHGELRGIFALAARAGVDWTVTEAHTGSISLWSVQDGSLKARLLSLVEGNLGSIQWSPDAKLFAAGTSAGVRIWCLDELATAPTVMPLPSRVAKP